MANYLWRIIPQKRRAYKKLSEKFVGFYKERKKSP